MIFLTKGPGKPVPTPKPRFVSYLCYGHIGVIEHMLGFFETKIQPVLMDCFLENNLKPFIEFFIIETNFQSQSAYRESLAGIFL